MDTKTSSTAKLADARAREVGPVTQAIKAIRGEEPASRRGFLSGLVSLPLIGGGVTLIGTPSAVAEPVSIKLLESYDTFLVYERCRLKAEMYGPGSYWDGVPGAEVALEMALGMIPANNGGMRWHSRTSHEHSPPSTRAALVLSAVGCDWRKGGL